MSSILTLSLHGPKWLLHNLHKSSGLYSREKKIGKATPTEYEEKRRDGEAFPELTAAAEFSSDLLARANHKITALHCMEIEKLGNKVIINGLDQSRSVI